MSKAKKSVIRYGAAAIGMLIMALAMIVVSPKSYGNSQQQYTEAPLNPEFIRYIRDKEAGRPWPTKTEEGYPLGLIPAPVDLSHLKSAPMFDNAVGLPASYDLRTKNKLTPIKDQGSYGTCWTFATYGSLESFLKPGAIWDFSEWNMATKHGFDSNVYAGDGGHMWMASAYLARWAGPLSEAQDPYQGAVIDGAAPKKHVQNIMFMPVRKSATDNTLIKNAVMNYGAVAVSMAWNSAAYRESTKAYYHTGGWMGGHAVCVVGWNDSFSKSKFASTPPGNGAFIVRNSWGSGWGESGYFYVSYYDSQFGRVNCNAIVKGEPVTNYQTNYGYDELGWCNEVGANSNTCWMSNIFTPSAAGSLKSVGFYVPTAKANYEIYIYTNVQAGKPRSGTLRKTKKGTINGAGYSTTPLGTNVPLVKGQKFSIVVKLTTPGSNYPICFEAKYSNYSSRATAASGQSYISSTGSTWTEFKSIQSYYCNVCLRGFAN